MSARSFIDEYEHSPAGWSRKAKFKARLRLRRGRADGPDDFHRAGDFHGRWQGFRCANCGLQVTSDPLISGVNHRNHCPYCLWSRHLDLWESGDRLAACKAGMRPVGFVCKPARSKYGLPRPGELLLVHACQDCEKVSLNRLAADDALETALEIFAASLAPDPGLGLRLATAGVGLLGAPDAGLVRLRLLGNALFFGDALPSPG